MEEAQAAEAAVCLQCLTTGRRWCFPKQMLSGNVFVRLLTHLCVYGKTRYQTQGWGFLCRERAKPPSLAGSDLLLLSQISQCIIIFMGCPVFSEMLWVLHKYEWICRYTSWRSNFQIENCGTERWRRQVLIGVRFPTLCCRRLLAGGRGRPKRDLQTCRFPS